MLARQHCLRADATRPLGPHASTATRDSPAALAMPRLCHDVANTAQERELVSVRPTEQRLHATAHCVHNVAEIGPTEAQAVLQRGVNVGLGELGGWACSGQIEPVCCAHATRSGVTM